LFLTKDGDDLPAVTDAAGSYQCLLMICGFGAGTDTGGLSPASGSGATYPRYRDRRRNNKLISLVQGAMFDT
jgi:hypothetical protein